MPVPYFSDYLKNPAAPAFAGRRRVFSDLGVGIHPAYLL